MTLHGKTLCLAILFANSVRAPPFCAAHDDLGVFNYSRGPQGEKVRLFLCTTNVGERFLAHSCTGIRISNGRTCKTPHTGSRPYSRRPAPHELTWAFKDARLASRDPDMTREQSYLSPLRRAWRVKRCCRLTHWHAQPSRHFRPVSTLWITFLYGPH
jgi:hypothetical protein